MSFVGTEVANGDEVGWLVVQRAVEEAFPLYLGCSVVARAGPSTEDEEQRLEQWRHELGGSTQAVFIDDPTVSACHAHVCIDFPGPVCSLKVVSSVNETFLSRGQPTFTVVPPGELFLLKHGDEIRFGQVLARVSLQAPHVVESSDPPHPLLASNKGNNGQQAAPQQPSTSAAVHAPTTGNAPPGSLVHLEGTQPQGDWAQPGQDELEGRLPLLASTQIVDLETPSCGHLTPGGVGPLEPTQLVEEHREIFRPDPLIPQTQLVWPFGDPAADTLDTPSKPVGHGGQEDVGRIREEEEEEEEVLHEVLGQTQPIDPIHADVHEPCSAQPPAGTPTCTQEAGYLPLVVPDSEVEGLDGVVVEDAHAGPEDGTGVNDEDGDRVAAVEGDLGGLGPFKDVELLDELVVGSSGGGGGGAPFTSGALVVMTDADGNMNEVSLTLSPGASPSPSAPMVPAWTLPSVPPCTSPEPSEAVAASDLPPPSPRPLAPYAGLDSEVTITTGGALLVGHGDTEDVTSPAVGEKPGRPQRHSSADGDAPNMTGPSNLGAAMAAVWGDSGPLVQEGSARVASCSLAPGEGGNDTTGWVRSAPEAIPAEEGSMGAEIGVEQLDPVWEGDSVCGEVMWGARRSLSLTSVEGSVMKEMMDNPGDGQEARETLDDRDLMTSCPPPPSEIQLQKSDAQDDPPAIGDHGVEDLNALSDGPLHVEQCGGRSLQFAATWASDEDGPDGLAPGGDSTLSQELDNGAADRDPSKALSPDGVTPAPRGNDGDGMSVPGTIVVDEDAIRAAAGHPESEKDDDRKGQRTTCGGGSPQGPVGVDEIQPNQAGQDDLPAPEGPAQDDLPAPEGPAQDDLPAPDQAGQENLASSEGAAQDNLGTAKGPTVPHASVTPPGPLTEASLALPRSLTSQGELDLLRCQTQWLGTQDVTRALAGVGRLADVLDSSGVDERQLPHGEPGDEVAVAMETEQGVAGLQLSKSADKGPVEVGGPDRMAPPPPGKLNFPAGSTRSGDSALSGLGTQAAAETLAMLGGALRERLQEVDGTTPAMEGLELVDHSGQSLPGSRPEGDMLGADEVAAGTSTRGMSKGQKRRGGRRHELREEGEPVDEDAGWTKARNGDGAVAAAEVAAVTAPGAVQLPEGLRRSNRKRRRTEKAGGGEELDHNVQYGGNKSGGALKLPVCEGAALAGRVKNKPIKAPSGTGGCVIAPATRSAARGGGEAEGVSGSGGKARGVSGSGQKAGGSSGSGQKAGGVSGSGQKAGGVSGSGQKAGGVSGSGERVRGVSGGKERAKGVSGGGGSAKGVSGGRRDSRDPLTAHPLPPEPRGRSSPSPGRAPLTAAPPGMKRPLLRKGRNGGAAKAQEVVMDIPPQLGTGGLSVVRDGLGGRGVEPVPFKGEKQEVDVSKSHGPDVRGKKKAAKLGGQPGHVVCGLEAPESGEGPPSKKTKGPSGMAPMSSKTPLSPRTPLPHRAKAGAAASGAQNTSGKKGGELPASAKDELPKQLKSSAGGKQPQVAPAASLSPELRRSGRETLGTRRLTDTRAVAKTPTVEPSTPGIPEGKASVRQGPGIKRKADMVLPDTKAGLPRAGVLAGPSAHKGADMTRPGVEGSDERSPGVARKKRRNAAEVEAGKGGEQPQALPPRAKTRGLDISRGERKDALGKAGPSEPLGVEVVAPSGLAAAGPSTGHKGRGKEVSLVGKVNSPSTRTKGGRAQGPASSVAPATPTKAPQKPSSGEVDMELYPHGRDRQKRQGKGGDGDGTQPPATGTPHKQSLKGQQLRFPPPEVRVVFSQAVSAGQRRSLSSTIKKLGGRVLQDDDLTFTHLFVTKGGFSKSFKTLLALASGRPIVSDVWLTTSKDQGGFVNVFTSRGQKYLLRDPELEEKFTCSISRAFAVRQRGGVLEGRWCLVSPGVIKEEKDGGMQLKQLLEAAGGRLAADPEDLQGKAVASMFVMAMRRERSRFCKILPKGLPIFGREALVDALLHQKLDDGAADFTL